MIDQTEVERLRSVSKINSTLFGESLCRQSWSNIAECLEELLVLRAANVQCGTHSVLGFDGEIQKVVGK